MIETENYGYYHATNEGGYISWYEFAVEIFRQAAAMGHPEYDAEHLTVVACHNGRSMAFSKAARPFNSRLDKSKLTEKRVSAASGLAGCAGEVFERDRVLMRIERKQRRWDRSRVRKTSEGSKDFA